MATAAHCVFGSKMLGGFSRHGGVLCSRRSASLPRTVRSQMHHVPLLRKTAQGHLRELLRTTSCLQRTGRGMPLSPRSSRQGNIHQCCWSSALNARVFQPKRVKYQTKAQKKYRGSLFHIDCEHGWTNGRMPLCLNPNAQGEARRHFLFWSKVQKGFKGNTTRFRF